MGFRKMARAGAPAFWLASLALATAGPSPAAEGASAEALGGTGSLKSAVTPTLELVSTVIEVSGVAIIVAGAAVATVVFLYGGLGAVGWPAAFRLYRANLGRGILLGLELLVAADIIGTVAVTPSLDNLMILGLIVLIRTFLSFSLEVEIEGRWPWRRAEAANQGNAEPGAPGQRTSQAEG